jgi:hypothetical protein
MFLIYMTNNLIIKGETSNDNSDSKKYKSFTELKEEFYKKKGIKKYWNKPVEKGIKNDIDLL